MDPLTVSTAVLAFLSVSIKVCVGLRQFRGGAVEADTTINALMGDLGALRRVLESMETTFAEAGVDDDAVVRQTGHIGSHWRSLADALNDGHAALADFDELLQALNKQVRVLDEPRRKLRVQSAATKIALFRQQIQAYKDTLQLSLQTIILWNSVSAQKSAVKVLPGLDAIHQEIRRLATNVDIKIQAMQDLMIGAHESSTIRTAERLKSCISSAASVLSSASMAMLEVLEQDEGGSIGGDLAAGDVAAVLAWIQNNASEAAPDGEPTVPDGEGGRDGDPSAALAALSGLAHPTAVFELASPDPVPSLPPMIPTTLPTSPTLIPAPYQAAAETTPAAASLPNHPTGGPPPPRTLTPPIQPPSPPFGRLRNPSVSDYDPSPPMPIPSHFPPPIAEDPSDNQTPQPPAETSASPPLEQPEPEPDTPTTTTLTPSTQTHNRTKSRLRISRLFSFSSFRRGADSGKSQRTPWGLNSTAALLSEYRRKLCFVGDGACGKTCLLVSASAGAFPEVYVPTVFENYVCSAQVKGKTDVELGLWDTAGQEDYDQLRPLSYPDSHGIAICFAIDGPDSLINVLEKWYSEVDHFCKGVPIFLVGCKQDLRHDPSTIGELMKCSQWPVSTEVALKVAGLINASFYLETSAKTRFGMEKFMETMAEELLQVTAGRRSRRPPQSARQRADTKYLYTGGGYQKRLQDFPANKHCRYDPIRPDGSAWVLRAPEPVVADSAALLRENGTKAPKPSRSGFFGRSR